VTDAIMTDAPGVSPAGVLIVSVDARATVEVVLLIGDGGDPTDRFPEGEIELGVGDAAGAGVGARPGIGARVGIGVGVGVGATVGLGTGVGLPNAHTLGGAKLAVRFAIAKIAAMRAIHTI
jgi:hypothetical protein